MQKSNSRRQIGTANPYDGAGRKSSKLKNHNVKQKI